MRTEIHKSDISGKRRSLSFLQRNFSAPGVSRTFQGQLTVHLLSRVFQVIKEFPVAGRNLERDAIPVHLSI